MDPRTLLKTVVVVVAVAAGVSCGPKSMRQRMVDGERQTDRASIALDQCEQAIAAYEFGRAEDRLRDADHALADPDAATNPEADMLKERLASLKEKLPAAKAEKARLDLAKRVADRREIVAKSVTQFRRALADVSTKPGDRGVLDAARSASRKVHDDVEWDRELPTLDAEFKGYLDGLRTDLDQGAKELQLAERTLEFIDGPVKARDTAGEEVAKGRSEKKPDEKVRLLSEAEAGYRRCVEDAEKLVSAAPELQKMTVLLKPRSMTGGDVIVQCKAQVGATSKLLVPAKKVLAAAEKIAAKKEAAEKRKAELAEKKQAAAEKRKADAEAKATARREAAEKRKEAAAKKKADLAEKKKAAAEKRRAAAQAKAAK